MSLHTSTRIPVDDQYAALVGKAVYVFAYYEWAIIWIMEHLRPGFVASYSRGTPLTSGAVKLRLQDVIDDGATTWTRISKQELQSCCDAFSGLIDRRNALIHAHPCTDTDGSQILNYQTKVSRALSDMKWPSTEVLGLISDIDAKACEAGALLDRLR